jgi:hypothetical protein
MTDVHVPTTASEKDDLRKIYNDMNVKVNPAGNGLVAYNADGSVLTKDKMSSSQRKAFETMEPLHTFR